ncbi:MAG: hypothetical protein ACHQ1H_07255 [Nitrososphaerales archaeon]
MSQLDLLYLLIAANALIYLGVAAGIVRSRKDRIPSNPTVEDAFRVLERSLARAFPDLPAGYTWGEVMEKIKALHLELDWYEIENTFRKYQDFRYGGIAYKNANVDAILRLAMSLPKGEKNATLSQIQSSR